MSLNDDLDLNKFKDEESDKEVYKVYKYRWVILALFSLLDMTNAVLFVTFAPIANISKNYFYDGQFDSYTAINMLATVFLILYPIGTVIGVFTQRNRSLKFSMVLAGFLNTFGAFLRLLAAIYKDDLGVDNTYVIMLCAQCISALSYPMYVNLPPAIAATWFPINERDMATTLGAVFNPIGNAIGQILPPIIVSQSQSKSGVNDDTGDDVDGMMTLMLVEFVICLVPFILTLLFFKSRPKTPPSKSTKMKLEASSAILLEEGEKNKSPYQLLRVVLQECTELFKDKDFVILFICFSTSLGLFNALLTVFNQILDPHGYSNGDTGTLAAVCIIVGLIGSILNGKLALSRILMKKTKDYILILKVGAFFCLVAVILFASLLYSNNFWGLLVSSAMLGFFALPLLPLMMETCVECTYPIPEEVSVGILHNGSNKALELRNLCVLIFFSLFQLGANLLGVVYVFTLQGLLTVDRFGPPPFQAPNLFVIGLIFIFFILILFFDGKYKRVGHDADNRSQLQPLITEAEVNNQS